jgi:hypothetical protein
VFIIPLGKMHVNFLLMPLHNINRTLPEVINNVIPGGGGTVVSFIKKNWAKQFIFPKIVILTGFILFRSIRI